MGQLLSSPSMLKSKPAQISHPRSYISPLLDPKQPLLRRPQRDSVIALLSKPQQPSDGNLCNPVCPSLEGCHLFSKPLLCCLGSHPRPAPSLCKFQTPVNNSQSQTLIASLQLQKVTGLQSDLPLFPPCRHRPKPRAGSRGSSPVTCSLALQGAC